jgi:predicted amidohydrolase
VLDQARIGISQWLPVRGAAAANREHGLGSIAALAERGCDLVVLPELWPCGFAWQTLAADARAAAEPLDGPRTELLATAARAARCVVLAGTVPEADGDDVFNTALLFGADGSLLGTHRKAHLYTPAGEDDAFAAGDRLTVVDTESFGPVGIATCFDGDFPEVARAMRRAGARVVLHPAAYEVEAAAWWDLLYPANALANGVWWISANQCGCNGAGTLLGASRVIAPDGTIRAEAPRAGVGQHCDPALLVVDVELANALAAWDASSSVLLSGTRDGLAVATAPGPSG